MSGREPRIDPMRGDVLKRGACRRRVTLVWTNKHGVAFVEWREPKQHKGGRVSAWRRWSANAEVIHVAGDAIDAARKDAL